MNGRSRFVGLAGIVAILSGAILSGSAASLRAASLWANERPKYPPTRIEDVVETLHGVAVHDPYRWLEDETSQEVRRWTDAQNALTRAYLDEPAGLRERLKARLSKLYSVHVASGVSIHRRSYFYTKREGDKNQPLLYMKRGGFDEEARVVIDPNAFSEDGTVALDWWYPSPDGALVLYGRSAGGSELSTLYLRDVRSATDTALSIPHTRACSIAWDRDGQGFLYTRYPAPGSVAKGDENYYRHVYHHRFGTHWIDDPKIAGDEYAKETYLWVANSSDLRFQFLYASLDWTKNDLFVRKAGDEKFQPVAVGLDGSLVGDVLGNQLFLHTDYQAPRGRILVTDVNNPSQGNWRELVSQQKGKIESVSIIGKKLIVSMLEDARSRLMVYAPDGKPEQDIELPTLGRVSGVSGRYNRSEMFFEFESFAYPTVLYRYDLRKRTLEAADSMELDLDPAAYETRQLWFKSRDGTRVPMFVVHKKGVERNGDNPTILYGYGGFGVSTLPRFDRRLFPWLDAGGVYASANLRGGGAFGKEWHLAGRLGKKQNVFDDMIAAGEALIAERYTSSERLGMWGGSNGGLLIGAMITQRPDLFAAGVCAVPLLDMIRYHKFSIARLWIPEYGSADDAEQFKWLYAYSPYHNVKAEVKYPAVLLTAGVSDSRVDPMHARKMAARLQKASASENPILLWVESKTGHGAGRPLDKSIDAATDQLVFFMRRLGMSGE